MALGRPIIERLERWSRGPILRVGRGRGAYAQQALQNMSKALHTGSGFRRAAVTTLAEPVRTLRARKGCEHDCKPRAVRKRRVSREPRAETTLCAPIAGYARPACVRVGGAYLGAYPVPGPGLAIPWRRFKTLQFRFIPVGYRPSAPSRLGGIRAWQRPSTNARPGGSHSFLRVRVRTGVRTKLPDKYASASHALRVRT